MDNCNLHSIHVPRCVFSWRQELLPWGSGPLQRQEGQARAAQEGPEGRGDPPEEGTAATCIIVILRLSLDKIYEYNCIYIYIYII